MSKTAIQAVIRELESLPETDQRLVLSFLASLKQNRRNTTASPPKEPTLSTRGELLVFTGQLEHPDTDWVRLIREERDDDLTQAALGPAVRS